MIRILVEGVLFVAMLAAITALLFHAVIRLTPLGARLRETENRRRLVRELDLTCPIHGLQREEPMVRLPSGERICPTCYREAIHG